MRQRRVGLPVDNWPAQDRALWQRAQSERSPFKDANVIATWRPRTRATVAEGYGYALAWLAGEESLDEVVEARARWTDERLAAYADALKASVRPATVHNRILSLERALAVISPTSDRAAIRAVLRSLPPAMSNPMKRRRIQGPGRLVDLGFDLMRRAKCEQDMNIRKRAVLYRDGLQIALLGLRPIRRGNFAGLKLGSHLIRHEGVWWIKLPRHETKTGQPVEVPMPIELVEPLETYLRDYRPRLAGTIYKGDQLWVSYGFKAQAPHSLALQIAARTRAAFGAPINPHLFRDCAATSLAIDDPDHVRMAASLLGHRSFGTTQKHYNIARSLDAGRRYHSVVGRLRQSQR